MVVLLFVGFFGLLVGTLGMLFLWNSWNRLVSLELNVLDAWADYESEVQKKYEMLPSLHNIVKGYAAHELKFFEQLFVARQAASGALLAQNIGQLNQAQGALAQLTPSFNALSEAYPEVKADRLFLDLSEKLIILEQGLGERREFYNSVATSYNKAIQMIPTNIVAGIKGCKARLLVDVPDAMHENYVITF
ncbi:MAG: LemA family protein [Candidatus Poseidoniaceae archaeon]|jgi:LemA protein|tara:strand:+ start:12008 stop:12580 length:573 start_codon:yes stop_codon:yes gene_type:complete